MMIRNQTPKGGTELHFGKKILTINQILHHGFRINLIMINTTGMFLIVIGVMKSLERILNYQLKDVLL
jgi:hypothetical protein